MARNKLTLAYIANESKRKASYNKRKMGMLKKLDELTILCGVDTALIMYNTLELGPVVWPSVEVFQQRIVRFMNLPDVQQIRRMMSQESFVHERIQKLSTKLQKLKKDNREREMNALMHQIFITEERTIDSLSFIDLNDLGWVLMTNLTKTHNRVEAIMRDSSTSASSALAQAPTLVPSLPGAPSFVAASPSIFVMGTSNVVAPMDVLFGQNYQGIVGMQTDPTQGGLEPSISKNP